MILLAVGYLIHQQREHVLGQLGDPRFDSKVFFLPRSYRGKAEPLAGFVEIPPGSFVMGSCEGDEEARKEEFGNPSVLSIDYPYWIARYPVAVQQFDLFVAAGGDEPRHWQMQTRFSNRPVINVS